MSSNLKNHNIQCNAPDSNKKKVLRARARNVVTPYAFSIEESLLGQPLASPGRRLVAQGLDWLVIAMLTAMPNTILAGIAALTFFRASYRLKQKEQYNAGRIFLRLLAMLLLLGIVLSLVDNSSDAETHSSLSDDELTVVATDLSTQIDTTSVIDTNTNTNSDTDEHQQSPPLMNRIVERAFDVIDDLGLGLGWAAVYFSVLTAWWNGQTLGKRALGIKVVRIDGIPPNLWESFGRYGGYGAGLATGLTGFVQIFWDENRQSIQDKISETLVLHTSNRRVNR